MCPASVATRLICICPEVSIKGTNSSRNGRTNTECAAVPVIYVGDTCRVQCCIIICHQYMATWKIKEVETFDYKVNFLLTFLCCVHPVNASSSSESKEERHGCQAGEARGLLPCSLAASFTTCRIFLVF